MNEPNCTCYICGKSIYRRKDQIANSNYSVCSKPCQIKALSGVTMHSSQKKKLSKARKKFIKKNPDFQSGPKNPSWKGDKIKTRRRVKCPKEFKSMATKEGRVLLHRLLVAQAIGRPLRNKEKVHHLNSNELDNRLENLSLFSNQKDHMLFESTGYPQPIWRGDGKKNVLHKLRSGKTHPSWKGKDKKRPKYIKCPDEFLKMAYKTGFVLVHRLKVAMKLGRCLKTHEVVHHIDGNRHNNRITNLALFNSQSEHASFEQSGVPLPVWSGKKLKQQRK